MKLASFETAVLQTPRSRSAVHRAGPLLVALCLAGLTACGGSDSESSTASSAAAPVAGAAEPGRAGGTDEALPGDGTTDGTTPDGLTTDGSAPGPGTLVAGRVGAAAAAVVRTGSLEVVVDDVAAAAEAASRLVRDGGGQVESDERSRAGGSEQAVLRLRVVPAEFDATVAGLADLGEELARGLSSTDVTEQVVDLDSRLATQRASVERVRALLGEADTLGEVVQVEGELTRRTAELESLQARRAALGEQVALGSVELRLTASDDAPAAAGGALGFGDGLREGWDAMRAVGRAAGVALGAVLPFSPLLLLVGAFAWRARRRTTASPV